MPMPMADLFAPDVNNVPARSIYPTSPGATLGGYAQPMSAESQSPFSAVPGATDAGSAANVRPISVSGNPLLWWVGILIFLVGLTFVAKRVGTDESFRNIRPSFYNVMFIALNAILGIVGLKVIFSKWRVPGISDLVMAA